METYIDGQFLIPQPSEGIINHSLKERISMIIGFRIYHKRYL
jgi:hypothetical protein